MSYVNVGVKVGGSDVPTKKALKLAIAENPANVYVYGTSAFGVVPTSNADKLDKGHKYTVVGPNPYNARNWYATLEFNAKSEKWVVS